MYGGIWEKSRDLNLQFKSAILLYMEEINMNELITLTLFLCMVAIFVEVRKRKNKKLKD